MTAATAPDPAAFRYKPPRAETARANGALSRGPVTEQGRRRAARNALTHGLRARRHLAVPALGEGEAEVDAHFVAVRVELGAVGPVARHLAETVAGAILRAARADRLEGELLAGLAENGGSVATDLHDDRDARATLALLHRYRREADGDVRRSLEALLRLNRARDDGLLPDEDVAVAAQARLDATVAGLPAPSEPVIEKIEPLQRLGDAANDADEDDGRRRWPAVSPPEPPTPPKAPEPPRVYTGAELLRQYRWLKAEGQRASMWRRLTPDQRAATLAAALAERPDAPADRRDPKAPYDALRPLLAGGTNR